MSTPANDTGTGTEKDDGKSPYKGLRPYEKSDEDNFFGRDGETRILADKILSRKLTLLFAASGIGKSSLLQAALLPALERPDPPSHDALDVVYCNDWVKEPGVTLKKKVADELRRRHRIPQDYPLPLDSPLGPFLRRCTLFSSDPLVLILDQFEEFFNYQRHQPEFRPFIREMSAAIRDDATATRFLFSMREDFALELNAFKPELPTLLFDNYFRLEALSRDSARTVILEPLKRVGCDCEPALLEALLNSLGKYNGQPDSGSQPGGRLLELPPARIEPAQVQIICTQLWEKEHADRSRQLRLDTYQTMGGTDGLLKRYFEAKVAPLSAAQRALASRAFDFLVSSQGTKMAYPLYELLNRTGVRDADALAAVLVELEQARVLRRQERMETRDDRTEWEPYYELYHDLFAKAVNDWNRDYKIRRARRRTVFRVTGAVACSLLLAAVWNIVYQRTHDHLRLTPPAGLSDRIELWSGTRHDFDLIGQRSFRAETRLLRNEVAPDKQLEHAPVGDYDQLNIELIGLMSLIERIDAYREAGLEEQGLELARRTLVGRDPNASAKASQRLARFRNPETGAVVERFLGDEPDSERRRQLVAGWLGLPTTHALRRLEQASRDNAKEVRQQVAAMLGGFAGQPSGEQAVALLVDLLKDPDPVVRRSAASALGHFAGQPGGEQAIAPLVDLLKDPVVGRSAASALGHFAGQPGGEQAAAPLVDLLKDSDRDVRGNAADALGHFAGQHGGEQAIAPLVDLLKDPVVGRSAASALGHFAGQPGGEQAAGPLVDLLKDSDRDVRGNAADALGGFAGQPGGEQAVALLVDLLKDPDPVVRRSAADALGGFAGQPGGEQAVAPLVDLLKDPDRDVRNSATRALGGFAGQPGGDQAIAPLVDLLKDPNSVVLLNAASAIGRFAEQPGAEQAVAPLAALLKNPDRVVRSTAASALGHFAGQPGGEQAVAPLVALLKDPEPFVRRSAASALGHFAGQTGGEQAVTPLVALLKDPNGDVRGNAASALGGFAGQPGGEQTIAPLVHLLKDPSWNVRRSAADGLGGFAGQPGGEQAIAPLVHLLKDPSRHVRPSAASALGGFAGQPGGEQAVTALVALLKDPNQDARNSATSALLPFAGLLKIEAATASLRQLAESGTGAPGFPERLALALMNPDQPVAGAPPPTGMAAKPAANHTADAETSMREKNAALLMTDIEALSDKERNAFLPELARFPSPLILKKLLELETRNQANNRAAALLALGKTRDPTAIARLQAVAGDERETHPMRVAAIRGLGYTGSDPVAGFLVELIARNPSLANPIYSALDNMASKTALPFMERGLSAQGKRRQDWRTHRATWREAFNDSKLLDQDQKLNQAKDEWEVKLKALQPNEPLETWFAGQIARVDEKRAKELLRDPSYAIRRGAWIGFAQSDDAERVRWLIDEHANENNPLYGFAQYRAIDRLLQRLEVVGDANDLATLRSLQKEWAEKLAKDPTPKSEWSAQRRVQQTILQRIDWTIPVIADVIEFRTRLQAPAAPQSAKVRVESNKPEG